MAKANFSEWQNLMDFANEYEEMTRPFSLKPPSDAELGALIRKFNPQFFRTVFGYATLVDNFCDSKSDTLAVEPKLAKLMEDNQFKIEGGNYFKTEGDAGNE
jgi:hypothetical protein